MYRSDGLAWYEQGKANAADAAPGGQLGISGSLCGDTVLLGAGPAGGAVYGFTVRGQDCNCSATADLCDIAGGTSLDDDANGVPDECVVVGDPLPPPYPHNRLRSRYISFDPNKAENDGLDVAFKVELKSLNLRSCSGNGAPCRTDNDCRECSSSGTPCISAAVDCEPQPPQTCALTGETCVNDQAGSVGQVWWVGPEHPTLGNDVHLMVTEPYRKVSDNWPPVVHVSDCEILPIATCGVRAYDTAVMAESDELEAGTITKPEVWWADCVGELGDYCTGNWAPCPNGDTDCPAGETCLAQWPPPDGYTNFQDATAAVFTFSGLPTVTTTALENVDLQGNDGGDANVDPPNYVVNFTDIAYIIAAFQGRPYPFSDPGDCPNIAAWP